MDEANEQEISENTLKQLDYIEDPLRKAVAVLKLRLEWGKRETRATFPLSLEEKSLLRRLEQISSQLSLPAPQISEQQMFDVMTGKKRTLDVMPKSISEQVDFFVGIGAEIKQMSMPDKEKTRLLGIVDDILKPLWE